MQFDHVCEVYHSNPCYSMLLVKLVICIYYVGLTRHLTCKFVLTDIMSNYVFIRRAHVNHFYGIIADLTDRCPNHQTNVFRRLSQHLLSSLSCGVAFVFQDILRMNGPISTTALLRAENCSKTLNYGLYEHAHFCLTSVVIPQHSP